MPEDSSAAQAVARTAHMRHLVDTLRHLEAKLREGGGASASRSSTRRQADGTRTRRPPSRSGARLLEIGLLVAYDQYDGQAPAAGVVTGIGRIEGRPAVIVANDAT